MALRVATHLMFQGQAEEALALYAEVFPEFRVKARSSHHAEGQESPTPIAEVDFAGHRLIVIDSPVAHGFGFTPSMSLHVSLPADRFDAAVTALSDRGEVLMPPGDYGFSRRFAWVADRFGVSWQIDGDPGEPAR